MAVHGRRSGLLGGNSHRNSPVWPGPVRDPHSQRRSAEFEARVEGAAERNAAARRRLGVPGHVGDIVDPQPHRELHIRWRLRPLVDAGQVTPQEAEALAMRMLELAFGGASEIEPEELLFAPGDDVVWRWTGAPLPP